MALRKNRQLSNWMLNETAFDFGFSYPASLCVSKSKKSPDTPPQR